jgi:hypothetical protein
VSFKEASQHVTASSRSDAQPSLAAVLGSLWPCMSELIGAVYVYDPAAHGVNMFPVSGGPGPERRHMEVLIGTRLI